MQSRGDTAAAAQDWLWLALEAPLQPAAAGADQHWEEITGQKFTLEQRLLRASAFAKAGRLRDTERELELLQASAHAPLTPGHADWLLGKARSKAHVEHAEGARLLERSVAAHLEDADSLRLEAARLYMRAGQPTESLRIVDAMIRTKSPRSREALALGARARSTLGDYSAALRLYDTLLGKDAPKGKDDLLFEQAVVAIFAGQLARAVKALDNLTQDESRETLRARDAELAGVAALEADRKDDAIARFRAVITKYPFTLAAWLASDRLRQLGVVPVVLPIPSIVPIAPRSLSLEIPKNVAMLHDSGIDEWAAKALNEAESTLRNRYGSAVGEVLCEAYELLDTAERRYALSRDVVGNLDLTKLPDAYSRWRWDCRYPRPYHGIVSDLEQHWQLPSGLLFAVMRQESSFRERVQSPAGAVGLTQLMPTTALNVTKEFGPVLCCGQSEPLALDEARCNLELGARYLHKLLAAFDGQLPLAVLSYNAGPQAVNRWVSEKKAVPLDLFLAAIPYAETRNYAHYVLTNFLLYAWLQTPQQPLPLLG